MDWRRRVRHDGVDVGSGMVLARQSERISLCRAARGDAPCATSATRTDGASRSRTHRHRSNHFDCLCALLPAISDHDNLVYETLCYISARQYIQLRGIEMVTREEILFEIQKMPEQYLDELYQVIKDFESRSGTELSDQDVMAKLREIKISASPDFSTRAD